MPLAPSISKPIKIFLLIWGVCGAAPVAAVAAIDEETAEAALGEIVVEYEPLPSILSIEDALDEEKIQIHQYT